MTNKNLSNFESIVDSLAANGVKPSVKVLKTRGPRKGETWGLRGSQSHGTSSTALSVRSGDGDHTLSTKGRAQTAGDRCVGGGITLNKVGGMGKSMVKNLGQVQSNYEAQVRADRKAAAQDRIQERLDALLEDIRG